MKLDADDYAASFAASLDAWSSLRPRSLQRSIGVSDLGYCRSKSMWKMTDTQPTDSPISRQAMMGIAAHEIIGTARKTFNPRLLIETGLKVTLPSGVVLPGTADEIDPDEPSVTDYKSVSTAADLIALRKYGSTEQQKFQRHCYYLGAMQAGLVPPVGTVRNVWCDRAGQSEEAYVEQEPFDMAVVHAADQWLSDVTYAIEHGEADDVLKDKHFEHCRRFCEFFGHCRSGTDHADLTITDEVMIRAAEMTFTGRALEKEGRALAEVGRRELSVLAPDPGGDMVAYTCGEHRVRWSWVHQADGPGYAKLAVEQADA
jgi:hypothetical protein